MDLLRAVGATVVSILTLAWTRLLFFWSLALVWVPMVLTRFMLAWLERGPFQRIMARASSLSGVSNINLHSIQFQPLGFVV
jgi:hypothetical protein